MVSGEETDAVLDWLRAVRRPLASGTGAAMAVPPAFGKPMDVPFDALDCYPGAESSVIVMDGERIEGDWVSDGEGASFVGDRGGDLTRVDLLVGRRCFLEARARVQRAHRIGAVGIGPVE